MALLRRLDVVWIDDDFNREPGPKMVVCVAPEEGYFFRINAKAWPVAVPLAKATESVPRPRQPLECSGPLDIDDYAIQESLRRRGVVGAVALDLIPAIWRAVQRNGRLSPAAREAIRIGLGIPQERISRSYRKTTALDTDPPVRKTVWRFTATPPTSAPRASDMR